MACFSASMSISGLNLGSEMAIHVPGVLVRGSTKKSPSNRLSR